MTKILVSSKNPVKVKAVQEAFARYSSEEFQIIGLSTHSGVSEMPIGDQVYLGAKIRTENLIEKNREEDLGGRWVVSIEAGLQNVFGKWFVFSVSCVCDLESEGALHYGVSSQYEIPDEIGVCWFF